MLVYEWRVGKAAKVGVLALVQPPLRVPDATPPITYEPRIAWSYRPKYDSLRGLLSNGFRLARITVLSTANLIQKISCPDWQGVFFGIGKS
ncbi:hypothetical protein D9M73_165780 [compost metagenome]